MQITNFDEVIDAVKGHLKEYLEDQGINTSRPFPCIHPNHDDSRPSCSIIPGKERTRWKCFSCHERGDIFDAIHFLEGKPYTGASFISDTVIPLAKKYGIDVKERELSPEELRRIETFNAYKKASDYIAKHPTTPALEEMQRRGWDPQKCSERGLGSVDSTENFVSYLLSQGYTRKFLEDVDLERPALFNSSNLIFTISDERGRPCGFAAKNLRYTPENKEIPKYINSRNTDTDIKNNIYDKGKRLYNLDKAKREEGPLYIFEGYGDVETAVQAGLGNAVCIGGTALTEHHMLELKKLGKVNIILALDGDEPGQTRTNKIVDIFSSYGEFRLKIIRIPEEMDPDDFIRAYGLPKFQELKQYSAFEWKLNQFDDRTDPAVISDQMIKIIAGEPSSRLREDMAETLAKRVPYSKNAILDDVEKLINAEEAEKDSKRKLVLESLKANLTHYPSDWRINVRTAIQELETIEQEYSDDVFSPESFIKDIQMFKAEGEESTSSQKGYNLHDWSILQKALNGDWDSTLNLIGGSPNAGKTAMMAGLAYRLQQFNRDKDVMVLYQTTDDTVKQFTDRIICLLAQRDYPEVTLNMVKNPNGFPQARRINEARNRAYEDFSKLVADGRLLVRGGEQKGGNTVKFAHEWVAYIKKRYPERKIIYFLDNFHRLRDFMSMKEERTRFKLLSNSIKDIAKEFGISVWATVEYNKAAGIERPNNTNISESVAMEYDGNFIMHLYNELHAKREESTKFFDYTNPNGEMHKMPVVEGIIGKNKITEFKGNLFWDFYTDQSKFVQVTPANVEEREKALRLSMPERRPQMAQSYGNKY